MNTLRKINFNIGSDELYPGEQMRVAYSTAQDILDQTLENFGNLEEFKIDFLGKFIRSRENRNHYRSLYLKKQVELQLGYRPVISLREADDSELGDGPEDEQSDEPPKRPEGSPVLYQPIETESDLEYKPAFTQEELIEQGKDRRRA